MRMNKLASAFAILTFSLPVWAECNAPAQPELPDGASASMEEMLGGQKSVKAFQEANTTYRKCVEADIAAAKTAGESAETDAARAAAAKTHSAAIERFNAAVAAEEAVAGEFNTQVREYKAANAD